MDCAFSCWNEGGNWSGKKTISSVGIKVQVQISNQGREMDDELESEKPFRRCHLLRNIEDVAAPQSPAANRLILTQPLRYCKFLLAPSYVHKGSLTFHRVFIGQDTAIIGGDIYKLRFLPRLNRHAWKQWKPFDLPRSQLRSAELFINILVPFCYFFNFEHLLLVGLRREGQYFKIFIGSLVLFGFFFLQGASPQLLQLQKFEYAVNGVEDW